MLSGCEQECFSDLPQSGSLERGSGHILSETTFAAGVFEGIAAGRASAGSPVDPGEKCADRPSFAGRNALGHHLYSLEDDGGKTIEKDANKAELARLRGPA